MPRNTPTCVGKTKTASSLTSLIWKHPHVRGEDVNSMCLSKSFLETPPRAWGRLTGSACLAVAFRNTPTCVGKTLGIPQAQILWEKHPHVRGEDQIAKVLELDGTGNTPTCVGKTGRARP